MMTPRFRIVSSLLLALVLAIGFALVWGFGCGIGWDLLTQSHDRIYSQEELVVLREGTPAISKTWSYDYANPELRALDGTPLPEPPQGQAGRLQFGSLQSATDIAELSKLRSWQRRVHSGGNPTDPPAYWYFLHDEQREGRGWFEGYHPFTKRRIGFIGRNGFRADGLLPEELFPVDGRLMARTGGLIGPMHAGAYPFFANPTNWASGQIPGWQVFLVSDGDLLQIDLKQRSTATLLDRDDVYTAALVGRALSMEDAVSKASIPEQWLVARTPESLIFVKPETADRRTIPLPSELRQRPLSVCLLQEGALVWRQGGNARKPSAADLVWLDEQGRITRRAEVPFVPYHEEGRDEDTDNSWQEAALFVVACPIPMLLGLALLVIYPLALVWDDGITYQAALVNALSSYGIQAAVTCVAAILLAVAALRRHRRYYITGGWGWFGFILLLGVPGLVGYLLHRTWPVRRPCPACHARVPRDRTACAACGQAFPRPAEMGVEVFG